MLDQIAAMLAALPSSDWLAILQIIWIDIVLSGDNAVVIALASRNLPTRQRASAIVLGCAVAILLRFAFAGGVTKLLAVPGLKLVGGVLLLWIAIKLLLENHSGEQKVAPAGSLAGAIWTIAVADGLMSLDNVIAIAGVAKGAAHLILFGILVSIPLIIFGSTLILRVLDRLPVLVWAGAALLGWVAGDLIADEMLVRTWLAQALAAMNVTEIYANINSRGPDWLMAAACTALVVLLGKIARRLFGRAKAPRIAGS